MMHSFRLGWMRWVTLGLMLALSVAAHAQEESDDGVGPAVEASAPPPELPRNIYIPYEKLRHTFEAEGRGVFVPYEQFMALWRAARDRPAPVEPVGQPPVAAIVTEATNEATVERDVVRVKAVLRIDVLAKGWSQIPIRLGDAAITRATLDGEPARIVRDATTGGFALLYHRSGDEAESIELSLEYAKAITKAPGQNSVWFDAPQAPVSRWRLVIPEPGVKVNIHPLIAATEVTAEPAEDGEEPAQETVVLAFVGGAAQVRIDWTPRAEGAMGLAALANVQVQQQVFIEEGVTRVRADVVYDISRADLSQLMLEVPGDYKVANVVDANVRQWSVESVGDVQQITVQLFEPARGQQRIIVELEGFADDAARSLSVPLVRALNVGRQQGLVVTRAAEGLRAEVSRASGLVQVDASELPALARAGNWDFAYRYPTTPFDLVFAIEKVQPIVSADALVQASVSPQELRLDGSFVYTIERAGVFQLAFDVPAGYELRQVVGRAIGDAQAVTIDSHHLQGDDNTRLIVNLARRAGPGKVGVGLQLVQRLAEPDLLDPTGRVVSLAVPIPRAAANSVERQTGRVIVFAPESMRLNPQTNEGLRTISLLDPFAGLDRAALVNVAGIESTQRPVLAFGYDHDAPTLSLAVERRQPQVVVAQLLAARVEPGLVSYESSLHYNILFSGVKSLRIDIPEALAPMLRNVTPGVRDAVLDPQPDDVAEGYVAWIFTGEREFIGNAVVRLTWEQRIDELAVGTSLTLAVPRLVPRGVDRASGQIVFSKAETIDVQPAATPTGMRAIDPRHDLASTELANDAARAWEFHQDDWSLAIAATRYQLEDVARTSIERALVRAVVTRSDQVAVQALYRVRSARPRLELKLPPGVELDTEPLRINGRAVALERGDNDGLFISLLGQSADTPFVLELRYTMVGEDAGAGNLALPVFPEHPAVQKVHLAAYLPPEVTMLGSRGPWTQEMEWRFTAPAIWTSSPYYSDEHLIGEITTGVAIVGDPAGNFQTDGRRVLFSSLRPEPPPDGTLRLTTMHANWLRAIVFIMVALPGVLLLRVGANLRWLAIGAALVLLVLIGAFMPTFARRIVSMELIAGVAIVLVIWSVQYLGWTRPNDPLVLARRQLREARAQARLQAAGVGGVAMATSTIEEEAIEDQGKDADESRDETAGGQRDE